MRKAALLLAAALLASACNEAEVPPERLPRFEPATSTPRVALVLGSGGPRGFAHVGVLKVLEENGIRPDLVVGASVGAMVGALYASGLPPSELEKRALELDLRTFFFEWRVLFGKPVSGASLQTYVNGSVKHRRIEELPMGFAATVTRASDGRLAIFNQGDVGLAVRASGASPGQFEPVKVGDDYYLDGDEASPVPILAARALGAKVVIAVDVSAYLDKTPPGVPREWVVKDERRAKQITREAPAADVMLHPDIGYYAGMSDDYRRRVIKLAEAYTREQIPRIKAALAKAPPAGQKPSTARMPEALASR
jgi:NTE family protein